MKKATAKKQPLPSEELSTLRSEGVQVSAEFPEKLAPLFSPKRYKVLHGGRGGAKSWSVARALLLLGVKKSLRVLCARELQNSISESVHKLLSDQVVSLGLDNFYTIQKTSIRGINGTEFSFEGLKFNVQKIKSYEGVDIVWVEEAQLVSKSSWEVLIPTIRQKGSEIWITFNPELEADETYQRFVKKPPEDAWVVKVDWSDNKWFPDVLRREKDELRRRDYDAYLHVWEGHCRKNLSGAVYAKELREAELAGRITRVPYDPTAPVHTFWDLGWADKVSIWFAQAVGFEYHIIDFLQDSQRTVESFLKILQSKSYLYGTDYLPHDASSTSLGAGGRTIEQLFRSAGRSPIVLPRIAVVDGINAARTIFPNCWFDEAKCSEGLVCLRRYRYEVDPDTGMFSNKPLHDEFSHGADAFRYLGMSLRDKKPTKLKLEDPVKAKVKLDLAPVHAGTSWMMR